MRTDGVVLGLKAAGWLAAGMGAAGAVYVMLEQSVRPAPAPPVIPAQTAYVAPSAPQVAPVAYVPDHNPPPVVALARATPQILTAPIAPSVQDVVSRTDTGPLAQPPKPEPARQPVLDLGPKAIAEHEAKMLHDGLATAAVHDHSARRVDAPSPAVDLPKCVQEVRQLAARTRIYFGPNSAEVVGSAQAAIFVLAAAAQACPEARLSVVGFTDPLGDPGRNLKLSWERAQNVVQNIKRAGFSTQRIAATSHMEEHSETCVHYDVVDRRVEFEVLHEPVLMSRASGAVPLP